MAINIGPYKRRRRGEEPEDEDVRRPPRDRNRRGLGKNILDAMRQRFKKIRKSKHGA